MTMVNHFLPLASRLQDEGEADRTPNNDEGSESSWCEQGVGELGENTEADGTGVDEGSNDKSDRPIQEKHVDALYTIFQRGDMKRASYPLVVLSTRSEVQCMLHEMGYDDTTDADDVPSFDQWLLVNSRQVELLDGEHRVAALKRLVSGTDAGKQELYWPCNIYDRGMPPTRRRTGCTVCVVTGDGVTDALPPELNLALRMNRRDPTMADSHGDIWLLETTGLTR
ncbi:ATP-dependent DNA helicase MER3 [Purpureocillium lavendulum]|uniref:ATP-dependent DNA helicase MER3 n=1 Tax=Purpureocillium lavendulum TaxID=1247861 RepID=A0AB34FGD2_9HYPO|nr:ATP-dependent DNA helicase MER3 [Purpureocillium lavendulum]